MRQVQEGHGRHDLAKDPLKVAGKHICFPVAHVRESDRVLSAVFGIGGVGILVLGKCHEPFDALHVLALRFVIEDIWRAEKQP